MYSQTPDGLEQTLAVDYYAPALLTLGLLPCLEASPGSRVIMVSSPAERLGRLDWANLKCVVLGCGRGGGGETVCVRAIVQELGLGRGHSED